MMMTYYLLIGERFVPGAKWHELPDIAKKFALQALLEIHDMAEFVSNFAPPGVTDFLGGDPSFVEVELGFSEELQDPSLVTVPHRRPPSSS
jgi:hypothetical protein